MTKRLLPLLLVCSTAAADPKGTDPKLAQLVGRWEGAGTFTLRGKPTAVKLAYNCQRALAGPGIECSVSGSGPDGWAYNEAHLLGRDEATDTFHLFSVNDQGEAFDHAAQWKDAAKVAFVYDAKSVRETYTLAVAGKQLSIGGRFTRDGKLVAESTFTLARVP